MITHRNAWVNCVGTLAHIPMSPADRFLWTLPMFHANGWTYTWIMTAAGAAHVCVRQVEASAIYRLVEAERITMLCAAPTVLIAIANGPEPFAASCDGACGSDGGRASRGGDHRENGRRVRLEHHPGIRPHRNRALHLDLRAAARTRPARACERARIKARQGVELMTSGELRVVDENMQDVPHDGATLGEIVALGNVVMQGYYNDPEATAKAFRGGYFHTGDAAVVHADGYVEIRDRYKDVIISGGENISSIEVEGALLRHPAVLEVAVVGMPHERWGESPHAFIVLRDGLSATPEEMREFARGAMAHFKVPTAFTFVRELPKTATGKIQKYILRGGKSAIARQ